MRHATLATCALLVVAPALWGLDDAKDKSKSLTPEEQYQAISKEFAAAQKEYQDAMKAAKTPQERQKVLREKNPQFPKYAGRMVALAEKYPDDPVALRACLWAVQYQPAVRDGEKAYAVLAKHAESKDIQGALQSASFSFFPAATDFLRAVVKSNPDAAIQSTASYDLAQNLILRASPRGIGADDQKKFGEEALQVTTAAIEKNPESPHLMTLSQRLANSRLAAAPEMLRLILDNAKSHDAQGFACFGLAENLRRQSEQVGDSTKSEKLSKEAETMYERVLKEFADVKSFNRPLADTAKGALNELRHLGIGKEAPQIAAEDIDGKEFKLTDYRGKVVLLDFWGNW